MFLCNVNAGLSLNRTRVYVEELAMKHILPLEAAETFFEGFEGFFFFLSLLTDVLPFLLKIRPPPFNIFL